MLVYKKYKELKKAHLYLVDEGYILLQFKDKVDFELEDAKEVLEIIFDFVEGKSFVLLADARDIRSNMSHEARKHFANNKKITAIRKGQAIVVNSLHSRLIANFYMNFHKPSNSIKIFNDYNKAENWIMVKRKELQL
jgi:hypothetical protein